MRKDSIKYSRMNEEFMHEVSRILAQEVTDPRIHPMTSVLSVDVTPDLKYAKIYVSVFGGEEEKKKTAAGLKSATPHIRSLLAKNMNMRITPELTFVVDDTLEYADRMSRKIDEVSGGKAADETEE